MHTPANRKHIPACTHIPWQCTRMVHTPPHGSHPALPMPSSGKALLGLGSSLLCSRHAGPVAAPAVVVPSPGSAHPGLQWFFSKVRTDVAFGRHGSVALRLLQAEWPMAGRCARAQQLRPWPFPILQSGSLLSLPQPGCEMGSELSIGPWGPATGPGRSQGSACCFPSPCQPQLGSDLVPPASSQVFAHSLPPACDAHAPGPGALGTSGFIPLCPYLHTALPPLCLGFPSSEVGVLVAAAPPLPSHTRVLQAVVRPSVFASCSRCLLPKARDILGEGDSCSQSRAQDVPCIQD